MNEEIIAKLLIVVEAYRDDLQEKFDNIDGEPYDDGALYQDIQELEALIASVCASLKPETMILLDDSEHTNRKKIR